MITRHLNKFTRRPGKFRVRVLQSFQHALFAGHFKIGHFLRHKSKGILGQAFKSDNAGNIRPGFLAGHFN